VPLLGSTQNFCIDGVTHDKGGGCSVAPWAGDDKGGHMMTSMQIHATWRSISTPRRWSRCLAALAMTMMSAGPAAMAQGGPESPGAGLAQQRAPQHNLQIRRFTTASLTNARASQITANASAILQRNDGAGDVACATSFTRNGNVTAFSTGDGSIDSAAEFNGVIAVPGWVKVVNQINWCGTIGTGIIGCSPVPGTSLVVVRFTANQEGILWAHEFGHNAGLSHRNVSTAVMYPFIGTTRRRVNATECNAYRAAPAGAVLAQSSAPQPDTARPVSDIQVFVHQTFVHGVPYGQATQFGAAAVAPLLTMLRDKKEEDYWSNIVAVLGMIGEEEAVGPLINFIETAGPPHLSRAHYAAKTDAIMALGYVVNRRASVAALGYLKQGIKPESWAARLKGGLASYQASTAERDVDFSKHAILGLALSGRLEAAQILRSLQKPAVTESDKALQAQLGDLVSQALFEHAKIAKKGLRTYYRENGL
jgi:Matrixin